MIDPFCRYGQANGITCMKQTDDVRCDTHGQSRYAVCSGCGSEGIRACSITLPGGGYCDAGLCVGCIHYARDDSHGPVAGADVTGDTQTAASGMFTEIEKDLGAVIARILAEAAVDGTLKFAEATGPDLVATKVLRGVGLHLTVLNLSALARAAQMGQ